MQWNVERNVTRSEAARMPTDQLVERITLEAWRITIHDARPKRSVVLVSVEAAEADGYPYAYRYRFTFKVDE